VTFCDLSAEADSIRLGLLVLWVTYSRRILKLPQPDLSGFHLDQMELRELDLSGCLLRESKISATRFLHCNLSATDFSDSRDRGTTFEGCDLTGVTGLTQA
jgi:uncharacterized protein YjbI with pentapeptide repeats